MVPLHGKGAGDGLWSAVKAAGCRAVSRPAGAAW